MRAPTLTVDPSGLILTWSEDAEQLLGYSEVEAVGQSLETIIPPHLRGPHSAGFQRFVKTGHSRLPEIVTTSALHKSGAIVRLQVSVKAVHGAHEEIIAVRSNDEASVKSRPFPSAQMSAFGTELPTSALQRFRPESEGQLTIGERDREDRS